VKAANIKRRNIMRIQFHCWHGHLTFGLSATPLAVTWLLAALLANADTSFTGTGWLASVPVPGILATNGSGQVSLKGNVHVLRLQADDPRVAGRLQAGMDLAYQADGSGIFSGTAYGEAGIWNAAGTSFTPTGGVWDLTYRGVSKADQSGQMDMTGYGMGGDIDGLRVEVAVTRAAGLTFDPAVPYLASGTIKPAPVTTSVVVDDFADNRFTWTKFGANIGKFAARETNQQLTLRGTWTSSSHNLNDMVAWANPPLPWSVQNGQTIEARVDMVELNQAATGSGLAIYHATGQAYVLGVARNSMTLGKQYLPGNAWFRVEKVTIPDANVVLVLALTPTSQNVLVAARVLDKNSGAVLGQCSFVDTPASDPTLTAEEVAQLTGCRRWTDVRTDPSGVPWTTGVAPLVLVYQDTDETLPPAEATFDNFELWTYDNPQVAIERAVRITFPASAGIRALEGAPSLQGPWLKVQQSLLPGMQQVTVPASDSAKFFRVP
jgi:hypothetical protein